MVRGTVLAPGPCNLQTSSISSQSIRLADSATLPNLIRFHASQMEPNKARSIQICFRMPSRASNEPRHRGGGLIAIAACWDMACSRFVSLERWSSYQHTGHMPPSSQYSVPASSPDTALINWMHHHGLLRTDKCAAPEKGWTLKNEHEETDCMKGSFKMREVK